MQAFHLEIRIYSHHFSATKLSPRGRWLCNNFAKQYVAYSWQNTNGQYTKVAERVYAAANEERTEFRFHINQLDRFKQFLADNHTNAGLISWVNEPESKGADVSFKVRPKWVARDYQIPIVDYMSAQLPVAKFLGLQTGKGKSLIAMLSLANIGKRVAVVIKPSYIEKWIDDFTKTYDINPKDILVVQGSDQLIALTTLARAGKVTAKIIIFSNRTLQNWFSTYEKYHLNILDEGYACLPQDLFPLLNIGVRLIDEVHQDFHFNFKLDLYTHVQQSISLSATLENNDAFMTKMYELTYPPSERYDSMSLDKYIDAHAVYYGINEPDKIRTQEYGGRGYSHNAFEKSLLKRRMTLDKYCSLIDYILKVSYFSCMRKKKKALVFASTIDMCTHLTAHFSKLYPALSIKKYTSGDPYSNLLDSDICFSTLGSAGTAHDLPNLTSVILTVAVDSIQANIQSLGRLRKLDDSATEFFYFVCEDIPQHQKYDLRKQVMLDKRAKTFRKIYTGRMI
jgi:superfamily II DNA or RNA helicase